MSEFKGTPGQEDTSVHLARFYRDILAWVEAGTPHDPVFSTRFGLCRNFADYVHAKGGSYSASWDLIAGTFEAAGLDYSHPFNADGREYQAEVKYTNPARLAWIKARAAGAPIPAISRALGEG